MTTNDTSPSSAPESALLLAGRNRAVWRMLVADRAEAYLRIVVELCNFRDNHELEPLHDDIARACGLEDLSDFNQDIRQLLDWDILTERIEKERLRGYRDTRRRKFRYRVCDDAVALVEWLRMRRASDLEPTDADTRDQLSDMVSYLRETSRLLNSFAGEKANYENARSAFHRLSLMKRTTDEIARSLADLNIRLLAFAGGIYDIAEAKLLIGELERFTDKFVSQIYLLRKEIYPEIEKLLSLRLEGRWKSCHEILRKEAQETGLLMRVRLSDPRESLESLATFYITDGTLQSLTARIRESARMIWRKLNAHLRELERRSHRLEDIRAREDELRQLPPDAVPADWLRKLVGSAAMKGDMHEWTESVKAIPPEPVWEKRKIREQTYLWLKPRQPGSGRPVQSMDEAKLDALREWMVEHGVMPSDATGVRLSEGSFETVGDFQRVIDIARSGILGAGRRLGKIDVTAAPEGPRVAIGGEKTALEFDDLVLRKPSDK